ncbi:hypothetical protein [Dankookia sp. P2]|uniref:hypothetical protein n=1 Tax=Dankookia sp. P2 TaxID=3423955 RepID=UPI003D674DCC
MLADARNGLVSLEAARAEYGVAIAAGWTVDEAATAALRARPRPPLPAITRERAA